MIEEGGLVIFITKFFSLFNYSGTFYATKIKMNAGLVLWFQQFCAIFLKHFYHSIRFWVSVIWQLVIPLAFIIISLAFAKTVPGNDTSIPSRVLTIRNSAPFRNIDLFWATLGGVSSPILFKVPTHQLKKTCPLCLITNFFFILYSKTIHSYH